VLVAVGCLGLLVLGGLLSKGRGVWQALYISNRLLRCLSLSWLLCGRCSRSGSCPCGVGVGCCVVVRMGRSVMGCDVLRHRSNRFLVV
jgi:hypothetical protein